MPGCGCGQCPFGVWDSSGKVSLQSLCHGEMTPAMTGAVDLKALIGLIIRGGWPGSLELSSEQAALLPAEYLNAVIDDDVYRMDGIKRDTHKMRLLLRSLARNESTTATNRTLIRDVKAIDDADIDSNTIAAYLDIFKRLFITDNQPPFLVGIRSSVRIKQAEKRHFADPSLACALLKATPASLLGDLETLLDSCSKRCASGTCASMRNLSVPACIIIRTIKIRKSMQSLNCRMGHGALLKSSSAPTRSMQLRPICWKSKNKSKKIPRANRLRYSVSCAVWLMQHISGRTACL